MSISKKTKLKRFELLADMLENHKSIFPKVKFNLSYWAENNKPNAPVKCLTDGACKTAACAVGSAILFPPFNKMGLKARYSGCGSEWTDGSSFEPIYKGLDNWAAVHAFFGVSETEGYWLFQTYGYKGGNPNAKTVAKRVRKFIDNGFEM